MLHQIGETYHQTPAQQLGIVDDPALAFVINSAALWAGMVRPKEEKADDMSRLQRRGAY